MACREIIDEQGNAWTVWDTYPGSAQRIGLSTLEGGWLTFQKDEERRRLMPVPTGWSEEPDERLVKWLARATPVTSRRSSEPAAGVDLPSNAAETKPLGSQSPHA